MKINLYAFGIARDIVGERKRIWETKSVNTDELKEELIKAFPELERLKSLRLSRNEVYASANESLAEMDEIALIPPVSGG